ncbi:phosphotransferase [Amylibacter sp. SFDW26]|uniref:phosphotransferase n=1 Tax=Amylibacter sp. SFDW26 TaxID=2652722 RepID=UPI00186AB668|nr:phosphotransferase [Amylibacter sp. SFDW26]
MRDIEGQVWQLLVDEGIIQTGDVFVPLAGGRTNRVWKISGTCDLVCKLYSESTQNPLYENAPQSEYECLKQLSGKGVAPEAVCFMQTAFGDVLVYDYLHGTDWNNDVVSVAKLLARIHSEPVPQGLRSLAVGSDAVVMQTLDILKEVKPEDVDVIEALKPVGRVAGCEVLSFVHTDVVAGNLIQTTDGVRLIDWQCPGAGDPVEDLAMFLSPAMQHVYRGSVLTDEECATFVAAYPEKDVRDRYKHMAPFYHWRMAAYCSWKEARGLKEYGEAKLLEIAALEQVR